MKPRSILMLLAALLAAPGAHAQAQLDVGGMLRSLSGALRGKEAQPQKQESATPVMGVRGIDETEQQAAAPASQDYVLMEGWSATRREAMAAAAAKQLQARDASYRGTSKEGGSQ